MNSVRQFFTATFFDVRSGRESWRVLLVSGTAAVAVAAARVLLAGPGF
ncbi:MAG TPA: hypothetical protein VEZ11_17990 [Thermoanaerobaculia bacterium]|nr:hypothetical protein [Thermoanaerobaculia bacterium]